MNTTIIIVAVIIVLVLACSFISVSNKLNVYKLTIEESKSTVDIALGKRYDILKEMCATVKKFTEHEADIMGKLIAVRQGGSVADTNKVIENQNKVMRQIYAVGENYPELKSSQLYMQLQNQIVDQNEYLAAAKRTVNSNITSYNTIIVKFPSSIVASMKGATKMSYIIDETESKKNVSVEDMLK